MKIILLNKTLSTIVISTAILISTMSSQAEIYKWTDSKGVTHYSAQKPVQQKIKSVDIENKIRSAAGKYKASSKRVIQEQTKGEPRASKNNTQLAGPSKKLADFCKNQRKNLILLQKNYRNSWKEKDGKTTRLNQKQRQEKVLQIQKSITSECAGV